MKVQFNRFAASSTAAVFALTVVAGLASFYAAHGAEPGQRADAACYGKPVTTCDGLACKVQADPC